MFAKISESFTVNILHIAEVYENGHKMNITMDDGKTIYEVTADYQEKFKQRLALFTEVLNRLRLTCGEY